MTTCTHCGKYFVPKYAGLKLCFDCFKKRERAFEQYDDLIDEVAKLRGMVDYWQRRSGDAAPSVSIPADRLMSLIRLAHPDKHGNSAAANDATVWLLSLRKKT